MIQFSKNCGVIAQNQIIVCPLWPSTFIVYSARVSGRISKISVARDGLWFYSNSGIVDLSRTEYENLCYLMGEVIIYLALYDSVTIAYGYFVHLFFLGQELLFRLRPWFKSEEMTPLEGSMEWAKAIRDFM